jgi:hypothetical protein
MTSVDYNVSQYSWFRPSDPLTPLQGTWFSCFGIPSNAAPPITNNDINNLINKLYSEVEGSSFNLAVTLGQTEETIDGIANGANRIYQFGRHLRRGNALDAIKALGANPKSHPVPIKPGTIGKDLSSTWLDYRYGWEPLLGDVYDAAQLLAKQLQFPQQKRYRKRVFHEATSDASSVLSFYSYLAQNRYQICARITEDASVPQLTGLSNPLAIAWELMPYSFVFDWFLPVGDYLSARGAASTLTGKFCITESSRLRIRGIKNSVRQVDVAGDFYVNCSVTRTPMNSLNGLVPLPNLVPFGQALSWKRAVSAIALVTNFL